MWTFTQDVDEYAEAAEAFLTADPISNTVPLTVLVGMKAGIRVEGAYFGWWRPDGQVRGAVFRTPPHPLGLARMPVEAIPALVEALRDREVPEVVGPVELTDAFTAASGGQVVRVVSERLYALGTLEIPSVPGHGRLATAADLPLLVAWCQAFHQEVELNPGDVVAYVERRLAGREFFVWEDDGAPVSLAALQPPAGGVCRIGPVYTPPSCRRRGYGAAVTAFASRTGVEERCEQVVLFTDLANPTSNSVYQSIGYEPLTDYAHVMYRP
ncbi:GNAT family N-acetyltransferase [Nonomuraea sp. NPDC050536]|uniref:GNAT family N-acetyltransferase n=1 Tax=Nonomuraea sp. NPDC050536 TaxID=3364366 RepID=UPI0037C63622